jgi:hypothetical protein
MAPAVLAGCALVLARGALFVLYEQAHFDSDQAVVGLMARHVARGEAFPVYFYGQAYLLAIEAWLAAPFLLLFGTSVTALKAPILALNLLLVALLVRLLVRDTGLGPWSALAAALFVAAPPPVTASRLVEAQGGNVEPLVFALLLWMLRQRPWAFGALLGVAFLNREFALFAAAAWGLVALVRHGWRPRGLPPQLDQLEKVYLWGLQVRGVETGPYAGATAGFEQDGDREGWFAFLAAARDVFSRYGDVPFVHWASYEKSTLARYVERYGDRRASPEESRRTCWTCWRSPRQPSCCPFRATA